MTYTSHFLISAACLIASAFSSAAGTPVFDFETGADAAKLPYRTKGKTALDIVQSFATSGTNCLRFSTAAWQKGAPEWPAFELKPAMP